MAGFDKMTSTLNNLLHPKIDTSDKHDPTFLGVQRKRRVPPPESQFLKEERGKRANNDLRKHGDYLLQLDSQYHPESFTGDTKATRFGAGFNRRSGAVIQSDHARKTEDEKKAKIQAEKKEIYRRDYYKATHSSPWNPITDRVPESLVGRVTIPPESDFALKRGKKGPKVVKSQIEFQWTDKTAKAMQAAETVHHSVRQERLANEGLIKTKKDWSVAQQLHCGDGFCLPSLSATTK